MVTVAPETRQRGAQALLTKPIDFGAVSLLLGPQRQILRRKRMSVLGADVEKVVLH
jgi:hypothetical protein